MPIIQPDQKVLIEWELITNDHKIYLHASESKTLRKFVIEELCKRFEDMSFMLWRSRLAHLKKTA